MLVPFEKNAAYWISRADNARQNGKLTRALTLYRHALTIARDMDSRPEIYSAGCGCAYTLRLMKSYSASNRAALEAFAQDEDSLLLTGLMGANMNALGYNDMASDLLDLYFHRSTRGKAAPLWDEDACRADIELADAAYPHAVTRQRAMLRYAEMLLSINHPCRALKLLDHLENKLVPELRAISEALRAAIMLAAGDARQMSVYAFSALRHSRRQTSVSLMLAKLYAMAGMRRMAQFAFLHAASTLNLMPATLRAFCQAGEFLGAYDQTVTALRQLLHKAPCCSQAAYDLGVFLLRRGRLYEAKQAVDRCFSIEPENPYAARLNSKLVQQEKLTRPMIERLGYYDFQTPAERKAVLAMSAYDTRMTADKENRTLLKRDSAFRARFLLAASRGPADYWRTLTDGKTPARVAFPLLRQLPALEGLPQNTLADVLSYLKENGQAGSCLVRFDGHLFLSDVFERELEKVEQAEPSFVQRGLFRILKKLNTNFDGCVPFLLDIFRRMPDQMRLTMLGPQRKLWLIALMIVRSNQLAHENADLSDLYSIPPEIRMKLKRIIQKLDELV